MGDIRNVMLTKRDCTIGTVRLTPEGEVRWTTFSIFGGVERWRSESIQLGGVRSAKGVLGHWFDKCVDSCTISPSFIPAPLKYHSCLAPRRKKSGRVAVAASLSYLSSSLHNWIFPFYDDDDDNVRTLTYDGICRDFDPRGPAGPTAFWKITNMRQHSESPGSHLDDVPSEVEGIGNNYDSYEDTEQDNSSSNESEDEED